MTAILGASSAMFAAAGVDQITRGATGLGALFLVVAGTGHGQLRDLDPTLRRRRPPTRTVHARQDWKGAASFAVNPGFPSDPTGLKSSSIRLA